MNAAFDLIAEMRRTIASLYEKLCASDAHIIALEEQLKMKTAECESQNRMFVEQLKMKDAQCEQHAQRCRLAEHTTELTNLEATRRLVGQAVEHTRQKSALWMQYIHLNFGAPTTTTPLSGTTVLCALRFIICSIAFQSSAMNSTAIWL